MGAVVTLKGALVGRVAAVREDFELEKGLAIRRTTAATPARNPTGTSHRGRGRSPSTATATSRAVAKRGGASSPGREKKALSSVSGTAPGSSPTTSSSTGGSA